MLPKDIRFNIIGLYRPNPLNLLSINEIASRLQKKYPFVHKKTKEMVGDGLMLMKTIGRSNLCSLNLENPYTRYMLGFSELCKSQDDFNAEVMGYIRSLNDNSPLLFCLKAANEIFAVSDRTADYHENQEGRKISLVSRKSFLQRLMGDTAILGKHRVLYGIESYLEFICSNRKELQLAYNPLMRELQ